MLKAFNKILQQKFPPLENKNCFLAISGGKDSIALSQLLLKNGYKHTLLHCNFQLRGEESELDEAFIKNYAKQNNLAVHIKKFDTASEANKLKITIQETARKLRYNWFNSFLDHSNSYLLTAHHLDDSIETFFINLIRGTNIQGLSGIRHNHKQIIRPLLFFNSENINEFINQHNIAFRQDQSNFENKYLRNSLRNELIPLFEKKSNSFKNKVVKTMESLNQINQWVKRQAIVFQEQNFKTINNEIHILKETLTKQETIFLEFIFFEYEIHRSKVNEFKTFLSAKTGAKFLTATYQFTINRDFLIITKNREHQTLSIKIKQLPYTLDFNQQKIELIKTLELLPFNDNSIQQFDLNKIQLPITIRKWKTGDRIQPLGMKGKQLVSDILINNKFSVPQKMNVLVVLDDTSNLIAILGLTISERIKLTKASSEILRVSFIK